MWCERWARGEGVLSGLGGCLNCCSPVAKCPKDEVGNGRIMGIGGMGRMAEARLALRRLCELRTRGYER